MSFSLRRNSGIFTALFTVFIILEICFNLYFFKKGAFSQTENATGLFIISILCGVLPIAWFYNQKLPVNTVNLGGKWANINTLIWLCGLALVSYFIQDIWRRLPIDFHLSDVIPTVELAVHRFLNGEYPYREIDKWGYKLPLTYLPMQWGPYIIPEKLHIDYRWITLFINGVAGVWVIRRGSGSNRIASVIIPVLLLLNWVMLLRYTEDIVAQTIETMVAGYYMMFITGISGRSSIIKGLVISFCLMSRYSLVLWLPLWAFVEWVSGNRKSLITTLLIIGGFVGAIYVLPFLSRNWHIFSDGYHYYSVAALGEWNHLNENGQPYHLFNGQGFAHLFYNKLSSYSIPDRLKSLQKVHLLACLSSVLMMAIWYWFKHNKIDRRIFLISSFKVYLSIFLVFIQVPYAYLMITGSFVSIAMLAVFLRLGAAK